MTLDDISKNYLSWLNDKSYMRYSNQRFFDHDLNTAQRYVMSFDQKSTILLKVNYKEDFAGTLTLYCDKQNEVGVMGILVGREFSNKGIAKTAWNQAIAMGFSDLGLRKIKAGAAKSNLAMQAIFVQSGMQKEAVLKDDLIIDEKPEDLYLYCIFDYFWKSNSDMITN